MMPNRCGLALLLLLGSLWPALALQRDEEEPGWVGFVEGIESCIAGKTPLLTHGYDCIGRFSHACLNHSENQTTISMERCYPDEYRAWDVMLNRYFRERPKGALGDELQQIQRTWITYSDRKCGYFQLHYAGGLMARWLGAQCLADTTDRRAIELRFFAQDR
ncbi:MAG: lysozyme inhibitor LprI family protein [Phreatobacter sp.]|uniref:lysozyme inhibitor LprI family protein n=1 Tax=Phreatobacter sp. TaxID=1966341 RepID=UPI002733CC92|nr:lysozyme inhibitor LprI family protein [Phreatobacter sp.]MDP2800721.1 lysozyme inhibitor LprI family protein [Phreatobacter sp.]